MAKLELKSNQQILSKMISKFLSETGLNDINAGSFLLTLLEAPAREDFQQYVQMLNIIRNFNLDTTTGQDLDNKAFEFGISRRLARKATGNITILREETFEKVATTFYSGLPSPIAGNDEIFVNDASNALFGSSGTLIIGRGTSNEEEVPYTSAPVDNTNYWTITLDTPLSNDHGLDETVILKQGSDELINAGTVITVPATGVSPEITFTTNQDVVLLAGEDKIENVNVTASEEGSKGNIPIKAIVGEDAFSSPPFAGARAQNDSKFTTGRDRETDEELRDRIKQHIQSLSKGIKTAIRNAINGLVDPNTAKRVVSSNVVLPVTLDEHVKVYIDDGTGFEPSFSSRGLETLLESATGGEVRLQLDNAPMVKAQAESNRAEPYNMSAGPLTLTYEVGLESETITLNPGDFEFPASATAEEVVKAINNKATIIEARTSQSGRQFVIAGRGDENEDVTVTGGTANPILGLPTDQKSTLFLYKNDVRLSKDGSTAFIDTEFQENYNFASLGAPPWNLDIIIDGKAANPQTVPFTSSDFIDASAATADEVVEAINNALAGATATLISNGTKVRLTSNTQNSSKSRLQVTGGAANGLLGFPTGLRAGTDRDYVLNRFTGTVELMQPLAPNDNLTAGSAFTRAALRTASPEFYALTAGETLVVSSDGGADQTITFATTGSFSAAAVAALINAQLQGGQAYVRNVGGQNFLELSTNTYQEISGSIEVKSSSTAGSLNFEYDTAAFNQRPHKAFVVSSNSGPYTFLEGQALVVVIDNDPVSKTFTITLDFDGAVTSSVSTTVFRNLNWNTIFITDDVLKDFWIIAKSGANTTTGTVSAITNQGGNTWRYEFDSLPANLTDMAAGDQVTFSGMGVLSNNGNFLITAVDDTGDGYIEVTNLAGVAESGISGSALIGQRRQVSSYVASTGQITVAAPFRASFSVSDALSILPSTTKNVVDYFNNTKVTTLSTKAFIESVFNGTQVQISSKSDGSDGYVQVTGGTANAVLAFSTTTQRGLQGYNFYTGLLALVHKTIYGDDQDLDSYPGVGAAGIDFEIISPTVEELGFNIDVTLAEGFSLSNVEDEIRTAITSYVNSLGVNEDVILAEVVAAVMGVDGITDAEIISPAQNIIIADSEIARTRDSLITLG